MAGIHRILVPIDFSPCSKSAAEYALFLAEKTGATIDLVYVWEPPVFLGPEFFEGVHKERNLSLSEVAHGNALQTLNEFAQEIPIPDDAKVRPKVVSGRVHEEILALAASEGYDLVVMGTHGRKGLAHLLLGSETEKVIREASCPVVVVHEGVN
ncbi:MAG: universal stress protein [Gemmatimonadetes bacterium]|nr:universal stress protein [Gemmatimonadota bacterium]